MQKLQFTPSCELNTHKKSIAPRFTVLLQTFSEDAFYAWTYDRPASPYLWLGSVLIAVLVLGACLFPLAPYKLKVVVLYTSMGLLMTLVGALLVRGSVAGVTWMAAGRSFWILPNVLSEVISHPFTYCWLSAFRSLCLS